MTKTLGDSKIWTAGSLNIQAGLSTNKYSDYITKSWHHVLPNHNVKHQNIFGACSNIPHLDIFGAQEIDPGSLRSGFLDQSALIAKSANFDYFSCQKNRMTGLSTTANAVFSKTPLKEIEHWVLPSRKSSNAYRGALKATITNPDNPNESFCCVVAHLSLNSANRLSQSSFLAEKLSDKKNIILMGDFNDEPDSKSLQPLKNLFSGHTSSPTYPRWLPKRAIDLIWWKDIEVLNESVACWGVTDHCGVEISFNIK